MFGALLDAFMDALADSEVDMDVAGEAGTGAFGDWVVNEAGKSQRQLLLQRIIHHLWQEYRARVWIPGYDELLRRRMNHARSSRGNPYNIPEDFFVWIKYGDMRDIKEFSMRVIRTFLHRQYPQMSNSIIDRVMDTLRNNNFSANQRNHATQLGKSQKWYYLTNAHHSDNTIYRIRRRNISADKLMCQMELRFMSGPMHSYNYFQVPLFVFATMTFIPLTYLTRNGFLAGAWNFFWYSCLNNKLVATTVHLSVKPIMAFFNKKGFSKQEIEDMRVMRMSRFNSDPVHRQVWHKHGVFAWRQKYFKKPTRHQTYKGTKGHLK